jgi:carboxyl-terminal processing protease
MIRNTSLVLLGAGAGIAVTLLSAEPRLLLASPSAQAAAENTHYRLSLFRAVFERVRANYVEKPDDTKLIEFALNGMLSELDPHSSYMDAKAFRDMQIETRGKFGGLGIEITMEEGLIKVVTPIDQTPAAKAGIMANDVITHLNGEPVQGLTLDKAIDKIRGPVNTQVKLTILRNGQDAPFELSITREIIYVRPVSSRLEGDDVGLIHISQFNEHTSEELKKAISRMKLLAGLKLKGFILDLRNNPGGLLDEAISVSDAFLEKGEIVSTRGRYGQSTQRFNAGAGDVTGGKPLIVLINGGSASASEIVAGALQDHRRAIVVGTRSFGKGSVQTLIPLGSNNGALRLTTARYFRPSGHSIQAKGVSPDIKVLQDVPEKLKPRADSGGEASLRGHLKAEGEEQTGSQSYIPPDQKDDKALHAALDVIRGLPKNSAYPTNPKAAVLP